MAYTVASVPTISRVASRSQHLIPKKLKPCFPLSSPICSCGMKQFPSILWKRESSSHGFASRFTSHALDGEQQQDSFGTSESKAADPRELGEAAGDTVKDYTKKGKDTFKGYADKGRDMVEERTGARNPEELSEVASDALKEAADTVKGYVSKGKEAFKEYTDKGKATVESLKDDAKETVEEVSKKAKELASEADKPRKEIEKSLNEGIDKSDKTIKEGIDKSKKSS